MPASVPYDVQVSRAMPGSGIGVGLGVGASPVPIHGSGPGPHDPRDPRDIPNRMGLRELPRPSEMGSVHPLPSPHALQLGPPDAFRPRLNSAGERMFVSGPGHHSLSSPGSASVSGPSDRFSPEGRRDSAASAGAATGMRDRELGSGSVSGAGASYSDLRNSSTPGEPR